MTRRPGRLPLLVGTVLVSGCGSPTTPEDPDDGAPPCEEATALCAERVPIGPGVFLPVHSTHSLERGDPAVTRAVVVVHGSGRNGGDYFERMVAAVGLEGLSGSTVVVAPTFQTSDDGPAADEPYWSSGGWKRGHLSSSSGPTPRVGSYAAIDSLLRRMTDPSLFPAIGEAVVTGHSAGGQVAHRFAATGSVEDERASIAFRYVVANPSTYLYLGPDREVGGSFTTPDVGACPDYDDWHYGLENLNSYAQSVSTDTIRVRLVRRDVRILIGSADTLTGSLDVTCGADLQGRRRFERGRTLIRFMDARHAGHGHEEMIVPDIGHSSTGMYHSTVGRSALFGG